nr:MAG TPA: hypothetical protein [Caudoviricetes sp.]
MTAGTRPLDRRILITFSCNFCLYYTNFKKGLEHPPEIWYNIFKVSEQMP